MTRTYKKTSVRLPLWIRTASWVLLLFFLFIGGVALFRGQQPQETGRDIETAQEILAMLQPVGEVVANPTPRGIPQSAELVSDSGLGRGVAKRVFENGVYTHTVLAHDLPLIDINQEHYQGWLIRREPFDFISTSSLVHNVDGSWGLVWQGEGNEAYDEFLEVLITREPNDFNENPSPEHVLTGTFQL